MAVNFLDSLRQTKHRKFDNTLWLADAPQKRQEYAYRESPESCKTPGTGVITYPCCPHCGVRRGPDNLGFVVGRFCDLICQIAFHLHYKHGLPEYRQLCHRAIAEQKHLMGGDGI